MSAASCLLSEDQFLCSICLDVFMDPVSTPCGHNFCKTCITQHWDISLLCQCPVCKRQYRTRPELHVNTFISEMAAQFKLSAQQEASRSNSSSRPGGRMCTKHNAPLEMFCKTDHMCVCVVCFALDHKTHPVVPLKEEYEVKKAGFETAEDKIQPMIQERKIKIQQMKHSVELNKKAADREMAEAVQVFTALIESAKTDLNSLIKAIEEKQRTAEKRAEGFIKELEKEISELMKLSSGVERQQSEDPSVHNFSPMTISPPANKGTKVSVHPQAGVGDRLPSYDGMVVRAVNQLEKMHSKQLRRLTEAELQRVRQYKVNVALDPNTAEPRSSQSVCKCALSKQGFSAGRFYFEVSVKSHSSWTVGVATDMPYLKKEISLSPENGYWTISSGRGRLFSLFQDSKFEKVGVFVNYDDGLICFYDVLGAALIHSSTGCTFTKSIHPFFSPCSNDGVQIHTSACVIS